MSEFTHVSIYFTPMFHSFAIPPSQCAPIGSAERSTNTLLVAWPAQFTDCMTCLTSQTFLFCFSCTIAFPPVLLCLSLHMFELVFVLTCLLPCFHCFTIFPSKCAPTWLSRAIHQHSFSRLAGTQFTDCITCLTSESSAELSTSLSN